MIKVLELYGLNADKRLICIWCGKPIKPKEFKDELSKKEFSISSLCQKCQNKVFLV